MTHSRFGALAISIVLSACTPEVLEEGELGSTSAALAPDPSGVGSFTPCSETVTWDEAGVPPFEYDLDALIYYPRNGIDCTNSVYGPLAIILHASGYTYDEYQGLQEHLARNGIISVSIDLIGDDWTSGHTEAAEEAYDFVTDYMWTEWPRRVFINEDSLAIIGHSRGGTTARYLAREFNGDPLFRVRSVVSMAPSSHTGLTLTGADTIAYLGLYGTFDGDPSPYGSYRPFDTFGQNGHQNDGVWNAATIYKSLKLLSEAGHPTYSDRSADNPTVQGYVLAFLAAHNLDDITYYEDYIRGDDVVPGPFAAPVFSSYSDGYYRRVVDNFDDGLITNTTIGGVVSTFSATANVLNLSTMSSTYVHKTHALWMWGAGDGSNVTFTIPAGKRDASWFEFLSLRVGQTSGAPATGLRVQIRNGATWSPEVALTSHGAIPTTSEFRFGGDSVDLNHMATIRVPLSAFGAHNDVQFVRLVFRGDAFPDTFVIDNLEFSEHILKP
jgi:hypothetical protein